MDKKRRAPSAGKTAKDLPVLAFATTRAWSKWLEAHHASTRGLWLKIAKKGAGTASVTYAEALDGALAWGWIDGQKDTFNDAWWLQRFTPRTTKSPRVPGRSNRLLLRLFAVSIRLFPRGDGNLWPAGQLELGDLIDQSTPVRPAHVAM